jgi:hypothetical protein
VAEPGTYRLIVGRDHALHVRDETATRKLFEKTLDGHDVVLGQPAAEELGAGLDAGHSGRRPVVRHRRQRMARSVRQTGCVQLVILVVADLGEPSASFDALLALRPIALVEAF